MCPVYDFDRPPSRSRRLLLRRVSEGATVLDVGCWDGALGRFLARERGATLDGIEPDNVAAPRAALAYRDVLGVPIEEAIRSDRLAAREPYGAILLLDVLEHLVDPWEVLRACQGLLARRGILLVSLPNVAHWSVRKELLLGHWRYRDSGLLDRTHLRFFTRNTARELLAVTGWKVTWEGSSPGQPPLIRLPESKLSVLDQWRTLFATQLFFEAVAQPPGWARANKPRKFRAAS